MGEIYDSKKKKPNRVMKSSPDRDPFKDGSLKGEAARSLLEEAERVAPWADYVMSLIDWYEENGFLTAAQVEALERIIERGQEEER